MYRTTFAIAAALLLMFSVAACAPGRPADTQESTDPAQAGARLYADHCAACHGDTGAGDGPASDAASLVLQDLRYIAARNGGEFPETLVMRIIDGRDGPPAHLRGGMPVWGAVFSGEDGGSDEVAEARIAALAAYLRRLQLPAP